ncbi:hypothetical protein KAU88_00735 [Candidatus Bathyarchaeota archaeon]|nr:hypothetical protein [Candidatus Bathyarchaeota archaeon]
MTKVNLDSPISDYKKTGKDSHIHVLYVDDDSNFLGVTQRIVEIQGPFQVDSALSVKEAHAKMRKKEEPNCSKDTERRKKFQCKE